jgi:hypothetical protein
MTAAGPKPYRRPASDNQIPAVLDAHFDFDAAGGIEIRNRTAVLRTVLRFEVGQPVSSAQAPPTSARPATRLSTSARAAFVGNGQQFRKDRRA